MFSGLLTFLGGSVFRMIWGEVSHFVTSASDHKQELERMRLQGELDAAAAERNLLALKTQADLGIKVVEAQVAQHAQAAEDDAWLEAVKGAAGAYKSGNPWIDGWNQGIRPFGASLALLMMLSEAIALGFVIPEGTREVLFAFLGLYVADRSLSHRGK